jgi:hydroxymethylpyrimidine/phosphomethylpyrimidine kinase
LKTFAAFGVYGTSAITALTAQNTRAVSDVHVVPAEFVEEQIEAVVSDIGCDAVKTGMLATSAIVEVVAAAVESMQLPNLVVDPVMVAKSGDHLLDEEAVHALRWTLLRLARVVTPNIPEAEVLAKMPIQTRDDMREAARRIAMLKPRAVVIKGGHMPGPEVVDLVLEDGVYTELVSARVETVNTHGTGCTFAAAIAAQLAQGVELVEAVREAKIYVAGAMKPGIPLGGGHRPLDHFWRYRP